MQSFDSEGNKELIFCACEGWISDFNNENAGLNPMVTP